MSLQEAGKRGDSGLARSALEKLLQSKYPGIPIFTDLFPGVFSFKLRGVIPTFGVTPESEANYARTASLRYLRASDPITLKHSSIATLWFCLDTLGIKVSKEQILGVLKAFGIPAEDSGAFLLTPSQGVFVRDLPWAHLARILGQESTRPEDLTLESGFAEFLHNFGGMPEGMAIPFPLRKHFLFLLATGVVQSVIEGEDVLVDSRTLAEWGKTHNIWSLRQLLTTASSNLPALRKFRDWTAQHPKLLRDATGQSLNLGDVFAVIPGERKALAAPKLEESTISSAFISSALDSFSRFVGTANQESQASEVPPETPSVEAPKLEPSKAPVVVEIKPPSEFLFASRPPEAAESPKTPALSTSLPLEDGWRRYRMLKAISLSAEVTGGTVVPLHRGDTFEYSIRSRRLRANGQVFDVGTTFLSRLVQEGHCHLEPSPGGSLVVQGGSLVEGVKGKDAPPVPTVPPAVQSSAVPKDPIPPVRQEVRGTTPPLVQALPAEAPKPVSSPQGNSKEVILCLSDITGGNVGEVIALLTKGGWRVTFK